MIIDNADDNHIFASNPPLASLLPRSPNGSILLTSRNSGLAEILVGSRNLFNVPPMETRDAIHLLREKLVGEHTETDILAVVAALNNIPLAITQTAAFINRRAPRLTISGYLNRFNQDDKTKADLLKTGFHDPRRGDAASSSVLTTWIATLEQIRRDRQSAVDLLAFMTLFDSTKIPDSAIRMDDTHSLDDDLEFLRGYGLVEFTEREVQMQSLVQFCVRSWLSSSDMQTPSFKAKFVRFLSTEYPEPVLDIRLECEKWEPQVKALAKACPDGKGDKANWAVLMVKVATFWRLEGRYDESEGILRRLVTMNLENSTMADVYDGLSRILVATGKDKEAESTVLTGLAMAREALGERSVQTMRLWETYANALRVLTRYQEAEAIFQAVLRLSQEVLGSRHFYTQVISVSYVYALCDVGKYDQAETMCHEVLATLGDGVGTQSDMISALLGLAHVLVQQSKPAEAYETSLKAVNKCKELCANDHEFMAWVWIHHGSSITASGWLEQAETNYRNTMTTSQNKSGMDHRTTWQAARGLAGVLVSQENNVEAETVLRKLQLVYSRTIGIESPVALSDAGVLARVQLDLYKAEEAAKNYRRILGPYEAMYGVEHEYTLNVVWGLAAALRGTEQYVEAAELFGRARRGFAKIYGKQDDKVAQIKAEYKSIPRSYQKWGQISIY